MRMHIPVIDHIRPWTIDYPVLKIVTGLYRRVGQGGGAWSENFFPLLTDPKKWIKVPDKCVFFSRP